MLAGSLISNRVPPLKPSDTGKKALDWMGDFHVRHLPVVAKRLYQGLLSEEQAFNIVAPEIPLTDLVPELFKVSVLPHQHYYEVMRILHENKLTALPVVDESGIYWGLITLEEVLHQVMNASSLQQPGGVLVIETGSRQYSLAEIARLVEAEHVSILSSYISTPSAEDVVEVTLKLNHHDLAKAIHALERFGYTVKATFMEDDYLSLLKDRYDALMLYLNV